ILKGSPYTVEADGQTLELAPDEILISYEGPQNFKCSLEQGTFLALDTTLTPELEQEGVARDFNRLMQDQRKALNLDISDRIVVSYAASPRIAEAIAAHEAYLRNELLAEDGARGDPKNGSPRLSLTRAASLASSARRRAPLRTAFRQRRQFHKLSVSDGCAGARGWHPAIRLFARRA